MHLKRTLVVELIQWKADPAHKPLIIRGARQVGKTSLVRQFGREHFDTLIEINLEKPEHLKLFDNSQSVADFEQKVQLYFQKPLTVGTTLLFIDEIQASPSLITLLRFFAEERPELHVLAAGSLLEAVIGKGWSIPVGRVDYRFLYPLTFFEYLEAIGQNALLSRLKGEVTAIDSSSNELAVKFFRDYAIVGGLPEVVAHYSEHQNLLQLKTIYNRLQMAYLDDVRKYASSQAKTTYLQAILEQGPKKAGQLITFENFMDLGYRSREILQATSTIEQIMLLYLVKAVNSVSLLLTPKPKRAKKLLWLDVGLVNAVTDTYPQLATKEYSGHLMEQIVGQTLLSLPPHNRKPSIYYWSRNRDEGSAEVDYVYQQQGKTVAIEVKSGSYHKLRSLMSLGSTFPDTVLVRSSFDPYKQESWQVDGKTHQVLSVPLYLIERLGELVASLP